MTQDELKLLAAEKGTGYYLFLKNQLRQNIEQIREAFGARFGLAYSIKANYYDGVLNQALEAGLSFDCASLMELKKLLQMQVPADRIWINTPFLDDELLAECFAHRVMVVADSTEQLRVLSTYGSQSKQDLNIGLRLNFSALENSRFGMEVTAETLAEVNLLLKNPRLTLKMLHTHFSGADRSAGAFRERVTYLVFAYQKNFRDYPIELLNMGGGMAGTMPESLAAQFDYAIPSWSDYARAAVEAGIDALPTSLKLMVEPGMALVSNTFGFLAEVVNIKTIGDRSIVLLNTSNLFLKPTGHKKALHFEVIHQSESEVRRHELVGITCMENDLLGSYEGSLSVGDLVFFENVGAYTHSYRPDFIFEAPGVVEV